MATLKALVVDDASFVRDLIKRTVRNQFPVIELAEAHNGRKAQGLMMRTHFDLILCDWEMPEMSGMELLRWMRQQDAYKTTPFLMITSRGDKDHVIEAVKEGVSEYLGKPFSAEAISKKIIKVMGRKLAAAMSGAGRSLDKPDAFKDSASLLTSHASNPVAPAKTVSEVNLGATSPLLNKAPVVNEKPAAEDSAAARLKGIAAVRFADAAVKCVIKAVTLNEVKVIARRDQQFPGILDQAVVDIEVAEGQVARLNGYVHQLQAVDRRADTEFIAMIIRFVDEDPQKLEDLSRFIARFQPG